MKKYIFPFLFIAAMWYLAYCFICRRQEPTMEIDPSWKYQGVVKVHDELYQHEFIDSLGRTNIIFKTSPEIKIIIKP